ncbi:MAG TPA: MBL fold metallo-hydrolase [Candidatus Hydrogenedentes bacterium]|mgnify:CR=1 FL=1|nr:MBL fold metallo-hydrolase [Candidatus Hydrogenedentota bacterium]HOS01578.1 MBL fold metallo-hydrolase [Candidatus Hydrogenedentota bacterium]
MDILTIPMTPFETNCYVVRDGNEAIVVDPGEVSPPLLAAIEGCTVRAIVNTHGHCDHCGGNAKLLEKTGAKLLAHEADLFLIRTIVEQGRMFGVTFDPSPDPTNFIVEGSVVSVGGARLYVLLTPGHSPGHIVLVGDACVFAGDVLFAGSIGRTDLPGGNYKQLIESIRDKLLTLPDATVVYSGHGPATTIGEERWGNPFLQER